MIKSINIYQILSQDWSNKVTIHHLLTHTHGIIDLEEPLEFEQGTQFHYSQLGYETTSSYSSKYLRKVFQ